ncbi:MAG TPA: hypothetical protein VHW68_03620 [Actinomycetota bacterium]|jgi:hypothetical protein|nr:hypothetical protein [Actinomycetota bacterium]
MLKKAIIGAVITAAVFIVPIGTASAGQPGASCGSEGATIMPHGFTTGGFSNAEANYAGSEDTHSLVSGNPHAVSQYDIACVNVTAAGH